MWKRRKSVVNCKNEEVLKENKSNQCDINTKYKLKFWDSKMPSYQNFDKVFENLCGFRLDDLTSFEKFVKLLYRPTDPSSLGVARALFGLCMMIDIVHERGLSDIDKKWGDSRTCRFPLIHGMVPPTLPWMTFLYTVMWLGAFGIMLGYYFKFACLCFVLPYWYIFLLDKTFWNNHSYLYGIVATLFWGTGANRYLALDAKMKEKDKKVPLWNYFILRFQFFLLYFLAGLKKTDADWLHGYSVVTLSGHWVFLPFSIFFTPEQTNFFIVHLFGFIFDLTIGFWMLFDKTRIPAMVFCTAFHLMNTRLFPIGMFPYTCLATMPLFCHVDWPRKFEQWTKLTLAFNIGYYWKMLKFNLRSIFKKLIDSTGKFFNEERSNEIDNDTETKNMQNKTETKNSSALNSSEESSIVLSEKSDNIPTPEKKDKTLIKENEEKEEKPVSVLKNPHEDKGENISKKQKFVVSLLLLHIGLQFFLPYSHFITKGYNNWVPGLYGYSWNMMVNHWDTIAVVVQVRDNTNNEDFFIHPHAYVGNNKWWKHGDMVKQYAHCLKDNLMKQKQMTLSSDKPIRDIKKWEKLSPNISIYVDVWCSLNGRFQQRMFKPNVDILTAEWHPFKPVPFLVPLLTKFSSYRYKLQEIQQQVYTWSNYSDVYFVADYPGMQKLNFVDDELTNVSLGVIEGEVSYTEEGKKKKVTIPKGGNFRVPSGKFHEVEVISSVPACYMYTFVNRTEQFSKINGMDDSSQMDSSPFTKMIQETEENIKAWLQALKHIKNAFLYIVFHNSLFQSCDIKHPVNLYQALP